MLKGFNEVVIGPIDYKKYHQYINKRFAVKKIKIALEECKYLQDLVQRQPEAVNILCHKILQDTRGVKVDQKLIHQSLRELLEQRNKRFEFMLESMSIAEEKIIVALAKNNGAAQPQSKSFTAQVDLTPRAVKLNIDKLMNRGIIDFETGSYQVCDPLLNFYLKAFR